MSLPVEKLMRVDLEKARFVNVLMVYRDKFVEREEFSKVFENSAEIFKFFEDVIILGAVIDSRNRKVYFITLSTDHEVPYTTLHAVRGRGEALTPPPFSGSGARDVYRLASQGEEEARV